VRFDLVIALKSTKALAFSVVESKPPAHRAGYTRTFRRDGPESSDSAHWMSAVVKVSRRTAATRKSPRRGWDDRWTGPRPAGWSGACLCGL
jgi:hypothetical protein